VTADDSMAKPTSSPKRSGEGTVTIIGAGLAGIAAARALQAQGRTVVILEARERIGGRIWTARAWEGIPLELGASWVNGTIGNPVFAAARDLGLAMVPTGYKSVPLIYDYRGDLVPDRARAGAEARFSRIIGSLKRKFKNVSTDMPLKTAFQRACEDLSFSAPDQHLLNHIFHSHIEHEYAADGLDLSLWHWDDVGEYHGADVILPDGLGTLVERMAEGLDIRLGQEVTQIDHGGPNVSISTRDETVTSDFAVVTLPIGVLKSHAVAFKPELPREKSTALARLGMGLLNKIHLRFDAPFWPEQTDWLEYMGPTDSDLITAWFNHFKYISNPILTGFATGTRARQFEQHTDVELVGIAMRTLRIMLGSVVQDPVAWKVTRWGSDPLAIGSYSHIPPGASANDYDLLARPVAGKLFFAGEGTHRGHYGTVHGAFLSGIRAARQIQALIGRSKGPARRRALEARAHLSDRAILSQEEPAAHPCFGPGDKLMLTVREPESPRDARAGRGRNYRPLSYVGVVKSFDLGTEQPTMQVVWHCVGAGQLSRERAATSTLIHIAGSVWLEARKVARNVAVVVTPITEQAYQEFVVGESTGRFGARDDQ
jgi:monoamine oxidase